MTEQVQTIHTAFTGRESLAIEAGAGCGKTTLIERGHHLLPPSTLFLAFNKSIADELGRRMPSRASSCMTFHSLALRALKRRLGNINVDAYKYSKMAQKEGLDREKSNIVSKIISDFQLNEAPIFQDESAWTAQYAMSLMSEQFIFELDTDSIEELTQLVEMAMAFLRKEAKRPSALTFDDMLFFLGYYARKKRWNLKDYDCVVVDEAQDVSPIRKYIITLLSNRLIQVGDRRQAIYAFAGAMTNAMDMLSDAFNCRSLPLSITWRCDHAIIREASTIVGDFLQARPDAGDGSVKYIPESQLLNSNLDKDSMIICRMNAPLIKLALSLLKARIPFKLVSDFPDRLIKRVKKIGETSVGIATFKSDVFAYYDAKLADAGDKKNLIKRIEDERDTILYLASVSDSVDEVINLLNTLTKSDYGVILTTGHKAKGLEADHVFILRPDLCPAPWVEPELDPEQYQQELNLKYVMITRAKHNLIYVVEE